MAPHSQRPRRPTPPSPGLLALLGLLAIAISTPATAASSDAPDAPWWREAGWKYSTGLDYSRGEYGLDDATQLFYVPVSMEADFFPVRAKVTLPLLSIEGPRDIEGSTVTSGRSTGIGQVVGSVGYLWPPPLRALPYVELTTKLGIPTETSDELGNGKWSFSLQADAFKRFGKLSTFARGGRKFYTGSGLDDRFYTSVGASWRLHERLSFGLAYDWYQSSVSSVADTQQLSPFANLKLGRGWSVGPYGLAGLSEGAPDFGLGFSLSVRR